MTHGTFAGTGDEPHYQIVAQSLVFDRDLDLSNNYADPTNLIFDGTLGVDGHALPGRGGTLRSLHDVGLPLLFAPYFGAAYELAQLIVDRVPEAWLRRAKVNGFIVLRHLLSLAMIAFAAWIAVQLFDRFARTVTPARAFGWAALLTLSPPLLSHAFLFFPDIVSAAVVLWVFDWLEQSPRSRGLAWVVGVAAGGLFLLHSRNAGLVVAFVSIALYRAWRSRDERAWAGWFVCGVVITVIARTIAIHHLWGTFLTTPHASFRVPGDFWFMLREAVTRVLGWTLDQEHGLLPYAPIYLLVPIGWFALWRHDRSRCLRLSLVVSLYIMTLALPFVNPHGWRGGWSPAARYLVAIVPLLAILVFTAVEAIGRTPLWARALVMIQIALDAAWWQQPKWLWNDGDGVSRVLLSLGDGTNRWSGVLPSFAEPVSSLGLVVGALFIGAWLAASRTAVPATWPLVPLPGDHQQRRSALD